MAGVLVFSEKTGVACELVAGGRRLADDLGCRLSAAVLGTGVDESSLEADYGQVDQVYVVSDDKLDDFQFDGYANALLSIVGATESEIVLIGSTRRGRALAPRLAQMMGAACVTDARSVEHLDGRLVTSRLALGGNTVKLEAIKASAAVIAVSPGTFEADTAEPREGFTVLKHEPSLARSRAVTLQREPKASGSVNIEEAERLVCIGRGVGSRDDLPMLEALAKALGAEMAATRPIAYEYKWMAEDRMVGISGKTVSPRLYVVVGSSGQIQHSVSVRDSKVIVAINKDKSAPIFEMADYGIVGDLYVLVPRLTEALS